MSNHTETTSNISEFLPMMPARAMSASSQSHATIAQDRESAEACATMKHSIAATCFLALYIAMYLGGGFAIIGGIAKIFHTSAW